MSLPFMNTAPARTSATRWGALTAHHRVCADSMSLNAIATPAAREPGPLVTRWRSLTVAKVDSIGLVVRLGGPPPSCRPLNGPVLLRRPPAEPDVIVSGHPALRRFISLTCDPG